jgi:FAD/FMN-containing dehydrogenase
MGLTLGEIDAKTAPWHFPIGIFEGTGCGLILAGGAGYQLRKRGYSVDNILGGKVVTADGKYLTVNATENADLFWGIRGAGSSLCKTYNLYWMKVLMDVIGVVTELTVQTYKIESVFVSLLAWPLTVENLRKAINFGDTHKEDKDMATYVLVTHARETKHKIVLHQLVYFGDKVRQRHQLETNMSFESQLMIILDILLQACRSRGSSASTSLHMISLHTHH